MTRNILFLCHRLPYPPNKGDKIRSYALLRHLATRGTVSLGCFVDEPDDLKHLETARALAGGDCHFEFLSPAVKMWRSLAALFTGNAITTASFGSRRLQQWVDRASRETSFDDVVVFGSAMAPYLFKTNFPAHRVLFDMVDVDSDKWKQYAGASRGLWKWIYEREARILERLECRAARYFGRTLLVSDFEANTFREIAPASASKIGALTNGVDLDVFSPSVFQNPFPPGEASIVMTGRMDYRPNHEGALWFAKQILPHILKVRPDTRVYFVGAAPPRALRNVSGINIVVTGSVPDVRPYLQFATAVIAPLRIARGVQNKVLEAMAMAKPVIATRDATRSLAVEAGTQLWVENEPLPFAKAVLEAMQGAGKERVARESREYVKRRHSWPSLMADLDRQLDGLQRGSVASEELVIDRKSAGGIRSNSPLKTVEQGSHQ